MIGYRIVKILLEHGADANLEDHFGFCPLHESVSFGHLQVVDEMLTFGEVDINKKIGCFPGKI
jgi:ankyrin repeat protein